VSTRASGEFELVFGEVSVEDVGEASFERASGFGGRFPFAEFALVVDAARAFVAGLDERDGVQGGVELPVAGGVEPVAAAFAAGGLEWRGAGVAGEVIGRREAGDVTSRARSRRQLSVAVSGRVVRSSAAALSAVRSSAAPPGIRSRKST
jgi:hypothetical protein